MATAPQTVSLATRAGPMQGYLYSPSGEGARGAVIVVPEAFGMTEGIHDECAQLARAGYLALGIEIFHRTAPAGFTSPKHDFGAVGPHFKALSNDGLEEDLAVSRDFLRKQPRSNGKVAALGFCVGGFAAYLGACRSGLAASVVFYGGGLVHERPNLAALKPLLAETPSCPVLGLFGADDTLIPQADRDAIEQRLAELHVPHEIIAFPHAGHAFRNWERPSYAPVAAAISWGKTIGFLAEHLA